MVCVHNLKIKLTDLRKYDAEKAVEDEEEAQKPSRFAMPPLRRPLGRLRRRWEAHRPPHGGPHHGAACHRDHVCGARQGKVRIHETVLAVSTMPVFSSYVSQVDILNLGFFRFSADGAGSAVCYCLSRFRVRQKLRCRRLIPRYN